MVSVSGVVINTSYSHMGAFAGGIVNCVCCGPYSCRDKTFLEATGEKHFLLMVDKNSYASLPGPSSNEMCTVTLLHLHYVIKNCMT